LFFKRLNLGDFSVDLADALLKLGLDLVQYSHLLPVLLGVFEPEVFDFSLVSLILLFASLQLLLEFFDLGLLSLDEITDLFIGHAQFRLIGECLVELIRPGQVRRIINLVRIHIAQHLLDSAHLLLQLLEVGSVGSGRTGRRRAL